MLRLLFGVLLLQCVLMDGAPLVCAICGVAGSAHEFSTIGTMGSEGINRASRLRNDSISVAPGQHVHPNCRRDYCRDRHLTSCGTSATWKS